jgi:hypothetical protein
MNPVREPPPFGIGFVLMVRIIKAWAVPAL